MIEFKFKIKLLKGDLEKWKSYDEEVWEVAKLHGAKDLEISYKKDIRYVSVKYKSLKDQQNGVIAVKDFFYEKGFIQTNVGTTMVCQPVKDALKIIESIEGV